jgi:hypothetical protein
MKPPEIVADIQLFESDHGGRKGVTPSDHWGCLLEYEGELYECRVLLSETGPLLPGQGARTPVVFLRPELLAGRMGEGAHFTLREERTVAAGVVVESRL